MLGFIVGFLIALAAAGLFREVRRHRGASWRGHRRGHHRRWRGRYQGFMLRRLFDRLDTDPAQEVALREALDHIEHNWFAWRDEMREARTALARALEADAVSPDVLASLSTHLESLRDRFDQTSRETLERLHATLNAAQRRTLAELLRYGPRAAHAC